MKQFVTASDIANTVRMTKSAFCGAFAIVEGDTDARMYQRFLDRSRGRGIPALGKANALGAIAILNGDGFVGIFAIVDADFWRLDGVEPPAANIFATDTHDLEAMIVSSPALETVLEEFGSERRISHLRQPVRDILIRAALPIGFIRWISSPDQDNLSFRFKHLSFQSFILTADRDGLRTDLDRLLDEVAEDSHGVPLDRGAVKARLHALLSGNSYDPWQVCRGHDMIHVLAIGFREVFGNRDARHVSDDQVDRIMRLAYGWLSFSKTKLFGEIRKWEAANPAYPVLAVAGEAGEA